MIRILKSILFLLFISLLSASQQEDLQIALGGDLLARGKFNEAKEIYQKLYTRTKASVFARQIAIASASAGDLSTAFQYALIYRNETKDIKDLLTSKIVADSYIKSGEIQKAIALLENIKQQEDSPLVDNILGTLYLNQKQFDKALGLLKKYYDFSKDEEALKKILAVYVSKNQNQILVDTLAQALEKNWCSEDLCTKAIEIFNQFDANNKAYAIFKNKYQEKPTMENAKYYLQVLINQKKFLQAEGIAKSFPFDRRLLLDLYIAQNKFQDASIQARKIYEERNEAKFLAWSAIYAYQAKKDFSKEELDIILKDLEKAISDRDMQRQVNKENPNNEDAFFYNFLGYTLIEHGYDIQRGIALVKNALKIAPNSIVYIDSLAWGYYKMGDCSQAQSIFATIPKDQIKQDKDLKEHFELIGKCR